MSGQPSLVVTVGTVVSVPVVGVKVREPRVPGGGSALATPAANTPAVLPTASTVAAVSWRMNLLARTMELTLLC